MTSEGSIRCCSFPRDYKTLKEEVRNACPGTYKELKDVDASMWKPEIVVIVKEGEVLKIGMLEQRSRARRYTKL